MDKKRIHTDVNAINCTADPIKFRKFGVTFGNSHQSSNLSSQKTVNAASNFELLDSFLRSCFENDGREFAQRDLILACVIQ